MDDKQRQILDAALAIADADGLEAVSMRAVAARVGVSAMALYPHVGSKAALLDGLVGRLLTELTAHATAKPVESWREGLRAMGGAARLVARAHPGSFGLLLARPSVTADAAHAVDSVYQGLLAAGVPPAHVPRLERLISTFVLGFAISEVNGRFGVDDPDLRARRGGALPGHRAVAGHLDNVDWDAEFEADLADLETVIDALARQSAAVPPRAGPPA
jgi:AcrR family transcriptional regulator